MASTKRNESRSDRKKRLDAIVDIVMHEKIKKQEIITDELKHRNIKEVEQGQISKDFKKLGIKKNDEGFYSVTTETLRKRHLDAIKALTKEDKPTYFTNVAYHYMRTGKGKASQFEFHLREAFPNAILETTIKQDGLLMFLDLDHEETKALIQFLGN